MPKITLEDVIQWVVANRNNTEEIDEVNKATFPFTSKYQNYAASFKRPAVGGRLTNLEEGVNDDGTW